MQAREEGGDLELRDGGEQVGAELAEFLDLGVSRTIRRFRDQFGEGLGVFDLAPKGDLGGDDDLMAVALRDDLLGGLLAVPEVLGGHELFELCDRGLLARDVEELPEVTGAAFDFVETGSDFGRNIHRKAEGRGRDPPWLAGEGWEYLGHPLFSMSEWGGLGSHLPRRGLVALAPRRGWGIHRPHVVS